MKLVSVDAREARRELEEIDRKRTGFPTPEVIGFRLFIGLLLSGMYMMLTGGGWYAYGVAVLLSPLVLSFLLFVWREEKKAKLIKGVVDNRGTPVFWTFMVILLLPVVLTWLSAVFSLAGAEDLGETLFVIRYHSLWVALVVSFLASRLNR